MRKLIFIFLSFMPLFAYSQEIKTSVDSIFTKIKESVCALEVNKKSVPTQNGIVGKLDSLKSVIDDIVKKAEEQDSIIEEQNSKIKELRTNAYILEFFSREDSGVFGDDLNKIDKSKIPSYLLDRYNLYMNMSLLKEEIANTNKKIDELVNSGVSSDKLSSFVEAGTESFVNKLNRLCDLIEQGDVKSLASAQQKYFSGLISDFNKILDRIDNVGK